MALSPVSKIIVAAAATTLLVGCGLVDAVRGRSSSGGSAQPAASTQPAASAQPGQSPPPAVLGVAGPEAFGGVAPADTGYFADFSAVWAGSFLDPEPAAKAAEAFRKSGLTAFTVKKTLVEKKILSRPVGDYHLVLVGLFGELADAQALGRRLQAQGRIANWQAVPSDNPGELAQAAAQTAPLTARSEKTVAAAQERAGRPTPADSPAVTGEGFKKLVRGRYVGSWRDIVEARAEAERLTASGWPASVVSDSPAGGGWHRVYLAEPGDRREYRASPQELESARASAASRDGLVLLADLSGLKGVWGRTAPDATRSDASACAGYSRAGRAQTGLERLVGYVPDAGQLIVVKPVNYAPPSGVVDKVARPVRAWWSGDDSELTVAQAVYGPTLFNRSEVMARLRAFKVDADPAPLGPAFDGLGELAAISGRKTVALFSEFGRPESADEAVAALGRLKGQHGANLNLVVVYGDADDRGWRLAEDLAKAAGTSPAWDGCRLLADNLYFEKFVKAVFRR
ncbi:MAG: hypothetical protein LBU12_04990 [Deltaproteobacteria bacterium]|nr:hypothetical protein [Deltaproteobacteria bacterium]